MIKINYFSLQTGTLLYANITFQGEQHCRVRKYARSFTACIHCQNSKQLGMIDITKTILLSVDEKDVQ